MVVAGTIVWTETREEIGVLWSEGPKENCAGSEPGAWSGAVSSSGT